MFVSEICAETKSSAVSGADYFCYSTKQ